VIVEIAGLAALAVGAKSAASSGTSAMALRDLNIIVGIGRGYNIGGKRGDGSVLE
jgi:hypothetical protein